MNDQQESQSHRSQPERSVQHLKPVSEMDKREIIEQSYQLHERFAQLKDKYDQAPPNLRVEIRNEMAPIVERERELREAYPTAVTAELTRDRAPAREQQIGYSR